MLGTAGMVRKVKTSYGILIESTPSLFSVVASICPML